MSNLSYTISAAPLLSISNMQVAQSILMSPGSINLISGKPTVAEVTVSASAAFPKPNNPLLGVVGTFTSGTDSYQLVGCLNSADIDPSSLTATVFLYEKADSTNHFNIGSGTFSVQINPSIGVQGLPLGANSQPSGVSCTSNIGYVDGLGTVSSTSSAYSSIASPLLSTVFLRINPPLNPPENLPCPGGGNCSFSFTLVSDEDLAASKAKADILVPAIFPVSPDLLHFQPQPLASQITSVNPLNVPFPATQACAHQPSKCLRDAVELYDMQQVRAAGAKVDPRPTARYLGVVPPGFNFGTSQGYMDYLGLLDGSGDISTELGFTLDDVPQTSIVAENSPISTAHEITHTFGIRYPAGSSNSHQTATTKTDGFWVQENVSFPGQGPTKSLYDGFRSQALSYMAAGLGEPAAWPFYSTFAPGTPVPVWQDSATYVYLIQAMLQENKAKIHVEAADGSQLLFSGLVSATGQIAVTSMYNNLAVGPTVGQASHFAQIQAVDPSGHVLSTLATPLSFVSHDDGPGGADRQMVLAGISTGIPQSQNALSLIVQTDLNRSAKTFFPTIEEMRTAVANIPLSSFVGNPTLTLNGLSSALDSAESELTKGDLVSASQVLANNFLPVAIQGINASAGQNSGLDTTLNSMIEVTNSATSTLSNFAQASPRNNGVIFVGGGNQAVANGTSVSFTISSEIQPTDRDDEFWLGVLLDNQRAMPNKVDGGKWNFVSPPLAQGAHSASFQLYLEPKRRVSEISHAIENQKNEIIVLERQIAEESNPARKQVLQSQVDRDWNLIASLEKQIWDLRSPIGTQISINVSAN